MLGFYENFPKNPHLTKELSSAVPIRSLQQKMAKVLDEINRKTFKLEEVSCPSILGCSIVFEVGIADSMNFNFIDEEETKRIEKTLRKYSLRIMDLFCAVRYYQNTEEKRTSLRFDYYLIRIVFERSLVKVQVFHERGPRHVSPSDIVCLLVKSVNKIYSRKVLRIVESF